MTALAIQWHPARGNVVTTKKVGYDTSSQRGVSDSAIKMNSEPAKVTEMAGFRFPALAPKRRFKKATTATEDKEHDSEENQPVRFAIHARRKLKRSGRVPFRWAGATGQIRATS